MTTVATSKEALAQAKTRMEKAVEDFRKDSAGIRTGRANVRAARSRPRGLPRHADADQSAGHAERSRPGHDRDFSVGPGAVPLIDKAIRTSDLGLNPDQRRQGRARSDSPAHRRPPQGSRRSTFTKCSRITAPRCATSAATSKKPSRSSRRTRKSARTNSKRSLDELEKLTHSETKKIEDLSAAKEKEVMEIK